MWISKVIVLSLSVWAGLCILFVSAASPLTMVSLLLLGLLSAKSLTRYSVKPSYYKRLNVFTYVFLILFTILMTRKILSMIRAL